MDRDPYADPVLYDLEYEGHVADLAWYRALAQGLGGPVLELGCGTGRVAMCLLEDGLSVVGVDAAQGMLDRFQQLLATRPEALRDRCELVCADFLELRMDRSFRLVMLPFNALHHCMDARSVMRLLESVRRHLASDGIFALDCYLPDPSLYARDPDQRYEERRFRRPDTGDVLHSWEQSWFDAERSIHHVRYIYRDSGGDETVVALDLGMWSRDELMDMFARAGFAVLHEMADFEGTPMHAGAVRSVLTLRHQS